VREFRSHGSERGAVSNDRPYRTSPRAFPSLDPKLPFLGPGRTCKFLDRKGSVRPNGTNQRNERNIRHWRRSELGVQSVSS
jgi:hypothetical protein